MQNSLDEKLEKLCTVMLDTNLQLREIAAALNRVGFLLLKHLPPGADQSEDGAEQS